MNADQRILDSKSAILLSHKWLCYLLMPLELKNDKEAPHINNKYNTLCTSGLGIYYNEKFVDTLSESDLDFIMVHEVMHIGLLHCTNRFHYLLQDEGDREILDKATDYIVNDILVEAKLKIPEGGLYDIKYRGKTVDEVFWDIKNNAIKIPRPKMLGHLGEIKGTPEQIQEIITQIKQNLASSLTLAKMEGKLSENTINGLLNILAPKISWTTLLEEYMCSLFTMGDDPSWKRLSRRGIAQGIYLPSKKSSGLNKIIFCSDTSGSMDDQEIGISVSATFQALESIAWKECFWLWVDTETKKKIEIQDVNDLPKDIIGRGGTCFDATFKELESERPDVVIFFTDLEVTFPKEPSYPVVWITKSNHKAPFGKTIQIKEN